MGTCKSKTTLKIFIPFVVFNQIKKFYRNENIIFFFQINKFSNFIQKKRERKINGNFAKNICSYNKKKYTCEPAYLT